MTDGRHECAPSTALASHVARLARAALPARAVLLVVTCGVASACGSREPEAGVGRAGLAARLANAWDAEFVLDRAPAGAAAHARPVARGTVALLERPGHERVDALGAPVTHVGVYHVDFRPLGFSPPVDGAVPELVAGIILPDTVAVVLPAEGHDRILVLRGTLSGDSVTGSWSYGGRAVSGWGGRFVLRRRAP